MQKITPFLLFDGRAEEAANFYTAIFPNSKIVSMMRSGEAWRLRTAVASTSDDAEGVVWCENTAGEFFAWSLNDQSKRWPSRPSESAADTFARFYPGVRVNLEAAVVPGQGMAFEPVKY